MALALSGEKGPGAGETDPSLSLRSRVSACPEHREGMTPVVGPVASRCADWWHTRVWCRVTPGIHSPGRAGDPGSGPGTGSRQGTSRMVRSVLSAAGAGDGWASVRQPSCVSQSRVSPRITRGHPRRSSRARDPVRNRSPQLGQELLDPGVDGASPLEAGLEEGAGNPTRHAPRAMALAASRPVRIPPVAMMGRPAGRTAGDGDRRRDAPLAEGPQARAEPVPLQLRPQPLHGGERRARDRRRPGP